MSFADTIADDLKSLDGAGSVTYVSVSPSGNTTVTVASAVGQDVNRREQSADGGWFSYRAREWWLPVNELSGVSPKEGDYLTSSSTTYAVLESRLEDLGAVWWVATRQTRDTVADSGDYFPNNYFP